MNNMRYHKTSIFMMLPFFAVFIFQACNKEETLPCYECVSTNIITTAPILDGFPDTINNSKEVCNMTQDQIRSYELDYGGSYSVVIPNDIHPDGVLFQFVFSRKCTIK